jgi:glyoxylase-like metal-dependent hydrolase (beta-lactamase superfamily II)
MRRAYLRRRRARVVARGLLSSRYPFEPFAVDHPVRDGESFELAVTGHFLPGHTLDSTLYTFELADLRVGVCGDIAFGPDERGTYRIGLMSNLWASNLDQYLDSLHRLAEIPIDLLVPGHGGAVSGRANVAETVAGTLATVEALAANDAVRRNLAI